MAKQKNKKKAGGFLSGLLPRGELEYYDYNLLAAVVFLICFGLIILYSTSAYSAQINYNDGMYYIKKQGLISLAALIMAYIISQFDYHILAKLATFAYGISLLLLLITRFVGNESHGATRWLFIGPISFQPAELAKVAIIIFLPCVIIKMGKAMPTFKGSLITFGFGVVMALFTYLFTENLSTAIIIAGITFAMLFVAHPKMWPFAAVTAAGALGVAGLIYYLANNISSSSQFRIRRILVWLDPETYASDGGYQVIQGLYAIGSGGFFGKGLGNSTQKLSSLPEAQNDMIFSIICEELGVFGALVVTALFLFLLYRLMFIAQNAPDLYGSLIVTGIFAHIALQVFLNIAVVINLIPTTGITLPFISYGGTSVLFLMIEMAIALSVSRQIKFKG